MDYETLAGESWFGYGLHDGVKHVADGASRVFGIAFYRLTGDCDVTAATERGVPATLVGYAYFVLAASAWMSAPAATARGRMAR